jgi:hypothetical protein
MEDIQYSSENYAGEFARLVKTVVPSPAIKDVFEANLRRPSSQDIILVKVYNLISIIALRVRITALNCTVSA